MFSQEQSNDSGGVGGGDMNWLSATAPAPASAAPPPEEDKPDGPQALMNTNVHEVSSPLSKDSMTDLPNNSTSDASASPFDIFEQGGSAGASVAKGETQPTNNDLDIFNGGSTTIQQTPGSFPGKVADAADTFGAVERKTNEMPGVTENALEAQHQALVPTSAPAVVDPFSVFETSPVVTNNGAISSPAAPKSFHSTPLQTQATGHELNIFDSEAQTSQHSSTPQAPNNATGHDLDIFDSKAQASQHSNTPQAPNNATGHELDIFDNKAQASQHSTTPQAPTNISGHELDIFGQGQEMRPQPSQSYASSAELVAVGVGNNYSLEDDIFGLNLGPNRSQHEELPSSPSRSKDESSSPTSPIRNRTASDSPVSQQFSPSSITRTRQSPNDRSAARSSNGQAEDPQAPGMPKDVDPKQVAYAKRLENQAYDLPQDASPLPDAEAILGSGHILSRISLRTIITKKWKQSYWVQYGSTQILLFRSVGDYQDWLTNPYHSQKVRSFLIKESIDFVEELQRPNVVGFQMTRPAMKSYERGDPMMWHFKLEKWMDYGATIAAAFASPNPRELEDLRRACASCIRASRRGGNGVVVGRIAPASPRRPAADDSSAVANCL